MWANVKQPKLQMLTKDKTYGIAINQYLSPQGTVNLVRNMLLEGATYQGYAFGLQMSELTYRYLKGRDVKFETNIHHPGDDMFKDKIILVLVKGYLIGGTPEKDNTEGSN